MALRRPPSSSELSSALITRLQKLTRSGHDMHTAPHMMVTALASTISWTIHSLAEDQSSKPRGTTPKGLPCPIGFPAKLAECFPVMLFKDFGTSQTINTVLITTPNNLQVVNTGKFAVAASKPEK